MHDVNQIKPNDQTRDDKERERDDLGIVLLLIDFNGVRLV